MKKKIAVLLLTSTLVLGLAACGSKEDPAPANTQESTTEATVESTSEATVEPTPEATVEPTPEAAVESEPEIVELPEDRAWVDDLYNKLVDLDVDGVAEILNDPALLENAAPYRYAAFKMWDYEEGYKLVTTDEKIVGLVVYSDSDSRYAFITDRTDTNDGLSELYCGDICVYIMNNKTGYFDGKDDHRVDGETYEIGTSPSDVWTVWHM